MAVLIEAISVVIQRTAIDSGLRGGWSTFNLLLPNDTLCLDDYLASIRFMDGRDVKAFVSLLVENGLRFAEDAESEAIDLAVVDQRTGPTCPCSWSTFLHVESFELGGTIAVCRHVAEQGHGFDIALPVGWTYEQSLSRSYGFIPDSFQASGLKFLRREGNTDVYWNAMTGREVYVGRTRPKRDDG